MRRIGRPAICLVLLLVSATASRAAPMKLRSTATSRAPDPAYSWKLVSTTGGDGYTTYILELTSQSWRTAADVDRPVWKHWLTIVRPERVKHATAFLTIGGGSNERRCPATPASGRSIWRPTPARWPLSWAWCPTSRCTSPTRRTRALGRQLDRLYTRQVHANARSELARPVGDGQKRRARDGRGSRVSCLRSNG